MKTYKTLIYTSIALITIIGTFVYSQSRTIPSGKKQTSPESALTNKDETKKVSENYLPYNEASFLATSDKKRALFFYANWCSTCRPADEDFVKNSSKIPEDIVIFRVNYSDNETDEKEKDLAKNYQITYQHTFVQVDAEGEVLNRWNGGNLGGLLQKIK